MLGEWLTDWNMLRENEAAEQGATNCLMEVRDWSELLLQNGKMLFANAGIVFGKFQIVFYYFSCFIIIMRLPLGTGCTMFSGGLSVCLSIWPTITQVTHPLTIPLTIRRHNVWLSSHLSTCWHIDEDKIKCFLICTIYPIKFSQVLMQFSWSSRLIHWGWVLHIYVSKPTIIGSDNDLSPGRHQAIIWAKAGLLLIGPLGTSFIEILIKIHIFSFKKMYVKISSGKCRPSCLGLNVSPWWLTTMK